MMSSVPGFSVEVRREGGAMVVAPSGELDLATVLQVREALNQRDGEALVVLDLRELSFMDSAGVQLVLEAHQRAEGDGVEFRVRRGPEKIQRLFDMTGLSRHLLWDDEGALGDQDGGSLDG
jgi:anti-sigma B factor antagonist